MNFSALDIVSPKRTRARNGGWQGFFPYYAGYPVQFAERILATAKLGADAVVLDPWNGSGTTTFAAADAGLASIGFDLNPVMVVVARARTLPVSEADALIPLSRRISELAQDLDAPISDDDDLLIWCEEDTARRVRAMDAAVRQTLVGEHAFPATGPNLDLLSSIAATQFVALFRVLRLHAARFTTSNPTWLKRPRTRDDRIQCEWPVLHNGFLDAVRGMAEALLARRSLLDPPHAQTRIINQDSSEGTTDEGIVDLVLTSPPYCTRIDYAAATAIELALLQPLTGYDLLCLRTKMLGSTYAPASAIPVQAGWGETCMTFLDKVRSHPSKASSGYYYRTHLDYFDKISRGLKNIAYSLKRGGGAILVVQDSYYKDVHNDLSTIITEMCEASGLHPQRREDFQIARTMAGRHKYVRTYRKNCNARESVLCFSRT